MIRFVFASHVLHSFYEIDYMNVIGLGHDTWHYQCSIKITAFPAFPRGFIT